MARHVVRLKITLDIPFDPNDTKSYEQAQAKADDVFETARGVGMATADRSMRRVGEKRAEPE